MVSDPTESKSTNYSLSPLGSPCASKGCWSPVETVQHRPKRSGESCHGCAVTEGIPTSGSMPLSACDYPFHRVSPVGSVGSHQRSRLSARSGQSGLHWRPSPHRDALTLSAVPADCEAVCFPSINQGRLRADKFQFIVLTALLSF